MLNKAATSTWPVDLQWPKISFQSLSWTRNWYFKFRFVQNTSLFKCVSIPHNENKQITSPFLVNRRHKSKQWNHQPLKCFQEMNTCKRVPPSIIHTSYLVQWTSLSGTVTMETASLLMGGRQGWELLHPGTKASSGAENKPRAHSNAWQCNQYWLASTDEDTSDTRGSICAQLSWCWWVKRRALYFSWQPVWFLTV